MTDRFLLLAMTTLASLLPHSGVGAEPASALAYPTTRKDETVDDYFGTKVADPYRWLEDDRAPETAAWVAEQNRVTFGYLAGLPERPAIVARLQALMNYERYGTPVREGGRYFYTHNSGLQNQRVLQVADALRAPARELLDPNTLAADGTVSLADFSVSPDGQLLAYGLQRAGSDWEDWHVRDVATAADRPDQLEWVKFSGAAWARDSSGFYYGRYEAPKEGARLTALNEFQKLYFHRIGQPQTKDALIYERKDHADWGFSGLPTEDGRYLVIRVTEGTNPRTSIFYRDLQEAEGKVVELLPGFTAEYEYVGNDGPLFFFRTDLEAARGRVVAIDLREPAPARWKTVIPEAPEPLKDVTLVGQRFLCSYLKDARSSVKIYNHAGAEPARFAAELELPGLGSATGFEGQRDDTETFFGFSSFTVPGSVYRLDLTTLHAELFREPKVDFHPADYETRQVFYPSADGTRIPMFITAKRGVEQNGDQPTILYGYGGFDISLTPSFNVPNLVWLERGGSYAEANLRGGGEYGREWHEAGIREKKQNVFDDFIAAAEYLQREKYTRPARLGITGGSNGGLLVGACLTQRPDLFGAAVPAVGVLDMLRFHKFTIGWAWTSDYGSSDDAAGFRTLYAYSPLHHLRPGARYPATLILTSDHDDRVVPAHSFKFAARLQECQAPDGPPVLIRIQTDAGHGGGTALSKYLQTSADELSFLAHQLSR